jgi:hypothetical protein
MTVFDHWWCLRLSRHTRNRAFFMHGWQRGTVQFHVCVMWCLHTHRLVQFRGQAVAHVFSACKGARLGARLGLAHHPAQGTADPVSRWVHGSLAMAPSYTSQVGVRAHEHAVPAPMQWPGLQLPMLTRPSSRSVPPDCHLIPHPLLRFHRGPVPYRLCIHTTR